MGKVRFAEKWNIEYTIPTIQRYAKVSKNESIIIFDPPHDIERAKLCLGVGTVARVEKGEKLDIVLMNFGRRYCRRIIVFHNHARRQVYTLKRGQIATFYGYYRIYMENNKPRAVFYAKGFNAWYVPKSMDIKNYDSDILEEMTKENETSMLNFLDDILNDDDEIDESESDEQ